ncbi:hypothetical protein PG991_008064 [Apiospora marii]|uniref:Uncharacterized protein n=1 Tax=Apiospora marii TaxID=335849 RepID=A0ABR1RWI6_9PEZI
MALNVDLRYSVFAFTMLSLLPGAQQLVPLRVEDAVDGRRPPVRLAPRHVERLRQRDEVADLAGHGQGLLAGEDLGLELLTRQLLLARVGGFGREDGLLDDALLGLFGFLFVRGLALLARRGGGGGGGSTAARGLDAIFCMAREAWLSSQLHGPVAVVGPEAWMDAWVRAIGILDRISGVAEMALPLG